MSCFSLLALQALLVFILYVRCTAINPADPGIMSKFDPQSRTKSNQNNGLSAMDPSGHLDEVGAGVLSSPSSASKSSIAPTYTSKKVLDRDAERVDTSSNPNPIVRKSGCRIGGILCALFVHEDCRKENGMPEQEGSVEDALFCTLCNAEVNCMSSFWYYLSVSLWYFMSNYAWSVFIWISVLVRKFLGTFFGAIL